jgi:hypothetical protein
LPSAASKVLGDSVANAVAAKTVPVTSTGKAIALRNVEARMCPP